MLFLVSITFFFVVGGIFAGLIRLELLTPPGDLVQRRHVQQALHDARHRDDLPVPDPVDPGGPRATSSCPMMIGARDLAFPRLNLLSWYIFMIGATVTLCAIVAGGRGHRLDVLHAVQHARLAAAT